MGCHPCKRVTVVYTKDRSSLLPKGTGHSPEYSRSVSVPVQTVETSGPVRKTPVSCKERVDSILDVGTNPRTPSVRRV